MCPTPPCLPARPRPAAALSEWCLDRISSGSHWYWHRQTRRRRAAIPAARSDLALSIAPSIFAANQTLLRSQTVYLCALTGRVRYGRFLEPVHFNVPSNVSQRNKLYELGPGVIRVGTRKSHVATECAPAAISRIRKMPKAGGRRSICALYKHTHVRSA